MTITEQYNQEIERNKNISTTLVIVFAILTAVLIVVGIIAQYYYHYDDLAFMCGLAMVFTIVGFLSTPIIFNWREKRIQKGYFLVYCQKHGINIDELNFNNFDWVKHFIIPKMQHLEDIRR